MDNNMKAEINNENKAKFFAQYWEQLVLRSLTNGGNFHLYQVGFGNQYYNELDYLELKPISSISDQDAESLGYSTCNDPINANYGMSPSGCFLDENCHMDEFLSSDADFLRSRGYLVPWMGLSCEELIKAGWAKYKE